MDGKKLLTRHRLETDELREYIKRIKELNETPLDSPEAIDKWYEKLYETIHRMRSEDWSRLSILLAYGYPLYEKEDD